MTAPLRISVIIPHFNQPELLAKCLSRITAQQGADFTLEEILVADNGSAPERGAGPICARHPGARMIAAGQAPGPGHARNMAVAEARGDLLIFTDADCLPAPGWLQAHAAAFATNPGLRLVGGDIRIARESDRPRATEVYEAVYAFRARRYIERDGYAATANMAVRAETFAEVGPFGGIDIAEDMDWGRRAGALGIAIGWLPQALVRHPARPDVAELTRKWDRLIGHAWTRARRSRKGRIMWVLKAIALILSPPAEIPRLLRSDRISGLRERLLAFRTLCAIRAHRGRRMLKLAFGGGEGGGGAAWRAQ
jgi:GT2 family glycosyltransferase